MRPKSKGSSTIGMKKSVVATTACVSFKRYTAASSDVSVPTRRSAWRRLGSDPFSSSASTPGAILHPQPPPCESDVKRGSGPPGTGEFVIIADGALIVLWRGHGGREQESKLPGNGCRPPPGCKPGRPPARPCL